MEWQALLEKFVRVGETGLFPLCAFSISPPNASADLRVYEDDSLRTFYTLCDGGEIGEYHWYSTTEVPAMTHKWDSLFRESRAEAGLNTSSLLLVLGTDSAGAPLVWEADSNKISFYWFKGGAWEQTEKTFAEFIRDLFDPASDEDETWQQALKQLIAL